MRKIFFAVLLLLFLTLTYETIMSFSTGIGGRTRKNSYGEPEFGCSCHNPDSLSTMSVRIYGPAVVAPGFTYTYRVTIKGGAGIAGGFDFNCWYGGLDTVTGEGTQNFGFDLTHITPKSFTGDSVSWLVKYIAKDTNTILYDTLYATGNSVNFSGFADSVDRWNFSPNFVVKIDPASIGIQHNGEIASTFSLGQNYPNPFNPVTQIKFTLSKAEFVTLKVYNSLGKEVETLVNKNLGMGEYTADWDASSFPSGVYFYRLSSETSLSQKKMVLIK
jgi:hypothetical protein